MRTIISVCLLSTVALSCCAPNEDLPGVEESTFLGYIPVEPVPVEEVSVYDSGKEEYVDRFWASLTDSQKLVLLPLQTAEVSIRQTSASGKMSYLVASAEASRGTYEVIMDYMKYLVDAVITSDSRFLGSRRVGVGLRMTARVTTSEGGVNISGLSALALGAAAQKLSGSLSINVIGIDSRDVSNLIPITSNLDQTSIEAALQALAAVKTKMWSTSETTITPHIIAVQQRKAESVDELVVQSYRFTSSRAGDCIQAWWKPGGTRDNIMHDSLTNWLKALKDTNAPTNPGDLITGAPEELRLRAIQDLNIPCDSLENSEAPSEDLEESGEDEGSD